MSDQAFQTGRNRGKSVAAIMAAACVLAAPITMVSEGKKNVAYADRVAARPIPTSCWGHTGPEVRVGQRFTDAQCRIQLQGDLTKHAAGVYRCTPNVAERTEVYAAMTDFAFNEGVGTYCKSSMARNINARSWGAACMNLSKYDGVVVTVNGRKVKRQVRGLKVRRDRDIKLCFQGVNG